MRIGIAQRCLMKQHDKTQSKAERLSVAFRRGIIIVSAVVFVLFYIVGFNMPYMPNPSYNAPLLTDWVIWLMWIVLALTCGVLGWSLFVSGKLRKASDGKVFAVPIRKISWGVTAGLLILMLLSCLLAGTSPITINQDVYADAFWLRMAGMFITSTTVMLFVVLLVVLWSMARPKMKGLK